MFLSYAVLGEYELREHLGDGLHGPRWRAVHGPTGEEAELWVLPSRSGLHQALIPWVAAVRGLDHPALHGVRALGRVGKSVARASRGRLRAGDPWLALAPVLGPSLAEAPPEDWPGLRGALLWILDALAAAHARGWVVGELSPEVLRVRGARVVLPAPGLAAVLGLSRPPPWPEEAATPASDLYALGHLARALAAAVEVPAALEPWCARLCAARPEERPADAIRAARGLLSLPAPVRSAHALWTLAPWARQRPTLPRAEDGVAPQLPASVPVEWRGPSQGDAPPLASERDRLWAALGDVISASSPRCVVIRGEDEAGGAWLGRWLLLRGAELGAGPGLRVVLGPDPWEADPVERLLAHLAPSRRGRTGGGAAPRPEERYAAVHAALARRQGPWVVVIEAAQHAPEALGLVSWLLTAAPLPLLLVVSLVEGDASLDRGLRALEALPGVWSARLAASPASAAPSAPSSAAAEVAAALGREVETRLWRRACALLGLDAGPEEAAALVEAGFWEPSPRGWLLGSARVRTQLLERAWAQGRWERLQQALAEVMAEEELPGRQGVHLARAGRAEEALEPLRVGAQQARERGALALVDALVDEREACLRALDVPPTDAAWGEGWLHRAEVACQQGRLSEAWERASRAMGVAAGVGDLRLRAQGLELLSRLALARSDLSGAMGLATQAADLFSELRDPVGMAGPLLDLGHAARRRGRLDLARKAFERASELLEGTTEGRLLAESLLARALADLTLGHTGRAEATLERALALFERHGVLSGQAEASNELGVVAAWRDELAEAERRFREAEALYQRAGHANVYVARLNLGLVLVEQERAAEAGALLEESLAPVLRQGRRDLAGAIHVGLLCDAALRQDWVAWDRHLWQARRRLAETALVDVGVARAAALAARLAAEAGEAERAAAAAALAEGQRVALGRAAPG